jgi:hypothetical protein
MLVVMAPQYLSAQISQREFHLEVVSVYNFCPHNLDDKQLQEKSNELDRFWDKVKTNKSTLLPFLRAELCDFTNNTFFLYDGSQLLLSLSSDPADKKIALNAIPRADLRDVQNTAYLYSVHQFAREGLNATAAALRILDYPRFFAYVPEHALEVDQGLALLFMLLPIPDHLYVAAAVERLRWERSDTSAKSLLHLLWYSVTDKGDSAIAMYANDPQKPKSAREVAKELQSRKKFFSPSPSMMFASTDISSLKKERSKIMQRISDEALYELKDVTEKIRIAYHKKK